MTKKLCDKDKKQQRKCIFLYFLLDCFLLDQFSGVFDADALQPKKHTCKKQESEEEQEEEET